MTFQSYLFVGQKEAVREKTKELAESLGIDLAKPSVDLYLISPLRKQISIDQIRLLKSHIYQKPFQARAKLVIIEQADTATIEAQAALLKILEEPPKDAVIVLETASREKLAPTIVSRVLTRPAAGKIGPVDSSAFSWAQKDLAGRLVIAGQVENPLAWLDQQMLIVHRLLVSSTTAKKTTTKNTYNLARILERLAKTREMIEANVHPRFALADLIFSLN